MAIATDDATAVRAAAGGAEKRAYVRQIFSEIAPRYDFLNHVLSLNIDRIWRRKAIAELGLERDPEGTYLDLCAGTMDISVMIGRAKNFRGSVMSADFAEPMLREGRHKIGRAKISPVAADAVELPFPSESMSGAIVAFGISRPGCCAHRGAPSAGARRAIRDPGILAARFHGSQCALSAVLQANSAGNWLAYQRSLYSVQISSRFAFKFPDP